MAHNEGENIREWIEFHVKQGVDWFVIYDHNSTDDTRKVLEKFPSSLVRVVPLNIKEPLKARIHMAKETMSMSKGKCKYVFFCDVDEYMFSPVKGFTSLEVIESIFNDDPAIGGIGLNWLCFGTRCETLGKELRLKTDGIVENCTRRAEKSHPVNHHIKTIFRPHSLVDKYTDPHGFHYKQGFRCVDLNGDTIEGPFNKRDFPTDKLRLHHYFISSIKFFTDEKLERIAYIHMEEPFADVLEKQARLMRELRCVQDTTARDLNA